MSRVFGSDSSGDPILGSLRKTSRLSQGRAFTLIELLIVIAIILILIAIALPNFLEAQIRARVTKAKADMRSIHTAQEMYFTDFKIYPAEHEKDARSRNQRGLFWLTAPIKYIAEIPEDPFSGLRQAEEGTLHLTYETGGLEGGASFPKCAICMVTWMIFSSGPDTVQGISAASAHYGNDVRNYSPTNGTKSVGSIYRWGGDPAWIGVRVDSIFRKSDVNNPAFKVGLFVDGIRYLHQLPPF